MRTCGNGRVAALVVAATAYALPATAAEPLPLKEIAAGVYVFRGAHEDTTAENQGAIANIGFVVGDDAVAVIDTGGSAAEGRRLRAALRQVTTLPIRYVVNTHVHPDHVFGNAAFEADGATFIGHANLPTALAQRGPYYLRFLREVLGDAADGTAIVPPSVTVDDALEIDLGGRALRLTAYPTAHTDNDLSVFDVNTATLWLSDLLFIERTPVMDGSLRGWLAVLEHLRQIEAARVVPGHGPVSPDWPAVLDAEERYLSLLLKEVRASIAAGETIEQAVRTVGRSQATNWLLFDDYNPRNVTASFTEIEWE